MDPSELKDEDLLLQLQSTEHAFVERKLFSDSKDWLKTAVAFANSAPIGYPAVLFIGVRNDGSPEPKAQSLDSIQKTFTKRMEQAYPTIYHLSKVLRVEDREVLAIIIPGSADRPHFAGVAYVRKGSESLRASDEQFQRLIAERNSKTYEILKWREKPITYYVAYRSAAGPMTGQPMEGVVADCNQFYVVIALPSAKLSFPLARTEISFDHENDRLQLECRTLEL